jgi:hypothetical protein
VAKLIYIGGYGQSGTTLFEYLICANPAAVACGEIANGFSAYSSGKELRCSCGELRNNCPVWSAFNSVSGRSWTHEALVMTLLHHIAPRYTVMTDSSKTAWGTITAPFRLRSKLGQCLVLLHVVRDPRAVCWSAVRRAKLRKTRHENTAWKRIRQMTRQVASKPTLRCLRTALGWWIANLSCELFGWFFPGQYLRSRYEDFSRFPRTELRKLFALVSSDHDWQLTEIGINNNRHQLYGNRMRWQRLLFLDVRPDIAWKSEMPRGYRRLVDTLTWPLRAKYRY